MTQPKRIKSERTPGNIGVVLRQRLAEKGLSIADLARTVDVTYEHMHGVISDRQPLSIPLALKIERPLQLDAMDLLRRQLEFKVEHVKRKMASRGSLPRP